MATSATDTHPSTRAVCAELARHGGREIKTMGDGFLATFDGPARAVYCAQAIVEGVRPLGIEVRAGVHTGEVEFDGDDVRGWPSRSVPASALLLRHLRS